MLLTVLAIAARHVDTRSSLLSRWQAVSMATPTRHLWPL